MCCSLFLETDPDTGEPVVLGLGRKTAYTGERLGYIINPEHSNYPDQLPPSSPGMEGKEGIVQREGGRGGAEPVPLQLRIKM
jgi:hypothetical protein